MYRTIKSIAIILIIIFICGCTKAQDRPHPEDISATNLNQAIQIVLPQAWNTFKVGDHISIQIVNISKRTLAFDKDFGSRIFIVENDQWVEVNNKLLSLGEENILIKPPTNNKNETRGFSFSPDLGEETSRTELRVYIFGKFSGTEEVVGAYTDVVLQP